MKRFLSIILCATVFATLFLTAHAQTAQPAETGGTPLGYYTYELLQDGTAEITGYNGSVEEVVIPSEIDGHTVTSVADEAFKGNETITKATFPDSVVRIGRLAFVECKNLAEITVPASVTYIGNSAFSDTEWFDNQPDGAIYLGKVCYRYKGECPEEYTVKNGTTCIAGAAFFGQNKLKKFVCPDSVLAIGDNAFKCCFELETFIMGQSVQSLESHAIFWCDKLKEITVPASVTYIDQQWEALGYRNGENGFEPIEGFVIKGYSGTEAERYANAKGFTFISLGEAPSQPEPQTDPASDNPSTPAESEYGLWIGGVAVTSANRTAVQGDGIQGSISYDPAAKVLTLRNASITSFFNCDNTDTIACFAGIYSQNPIEIRLEGESTIQNSATLTTDKSTKYVYGVFAMNQYVTISGTGVLHTEGIFSGSLTILQGATVDSDTNSGLSRVSRGIEVSLLLVYGNLKANEYSYMRAYEAIYADSIIIAQGGVCEVAYRSDYGNLISIAGFSPPPAAAVCLSDDGLLSVNGTMKITSTATAPNSRGTILNGYGILCENKAAVSIGNTGTLIIETNKYALKNVDVSWSEDDTLVLAGASESDAQPLSGDLYNKKYLSFTPVNPPASNAILGDADTDGEVTIFDATTIQRYLAELPVSAFDERAADADEDDDVTIFDATSVQRHLAELPTNQNIGKPIA